MQMVTEYSEKQMHEIGARIKFARRARGLNQGQLCDRARIPSIKIVSKYELGLDIPRGERLTLICKALGVTENYILEGETMAMSVSETVKKPQLVTAIQPVATPAKPVEEKKEHPYYASKLKDYVYPNAERLKELRTKHKLSKIDCAILCNLKTGASITFWENGSKRIALAHLKNLADFYGVPIDSLIDKEKTDAIKNKNIYRGNNVEPEVKATEEIEQPEPEVKKEPEPPVSPTMDIPERAEDYFCKNVKYYVNKRKIKDEVFEDACGCDIGFMDEVIRHSYKIPLTVTLKIARLLDMSIEELVSDTSAMEIEKEIAEYEAKIRELRKQMGMK